MKAKNQGADAWEPEPNVPDGANPCSIHYFTICDCPPGT